MSNDFATFCFQASLALLIALLAWGDQIRQPRKVVTEVVQRYLDKIRRTRAELAPIIENSYDKESKSLRYDLTDVTRASVKLMTAGQLDAANIEIIKKLQDLHDKRMNLEGEYGTRYFLSILLSIAFGTFGVLSILNGSTTAGNAFGDQVTFQMLYAAPLLALGGWILVNLILTFFDESEFVRDTESAEALIGAN